MGAGKCPRCGGYSSAGDVLCTNCIRELNKPKKFVFLGTAIAMLLFLLTACAPNQGTVKEKDYDPGYYIQHAGHQSCTGTGSNYRCTYIPGYMQWVPEDYGLLIADYEQEGWVSVSQRTYDSTNVGDYYDHGTITEGH